MRVGKKILIGSIILLLTTTPLIASAGPNENIKSQPMTVESGFLGTFNITHQPLLYNYKTNHGMNVNYIYPPGNPNLVYNFTELENGTVRLNFTLNFLHHLNQPGAPYVYLAEFIFPFRYRSTIIDRFWIHQTGKPDIYSVPREVWCTSDDPVPFNITVTGKYLQTNHTNVTLEFWCTGMPGITPIKFISYVVIPSLPGIKQNFLQEAAYPNPNLLITIHPVQET
jgi:hypothetical protein